MVSTFAWLCVRLAASGCLVLLSLSCRTQEPVTARSVPPIGAHAHAQGQGHGQVHGTTLPPIEVSLGLLTAVGASTERDAVLAELAGGAHDPRQRGFTFQQAELSFVGELTPWLAAKAFLVAAAFLCARCLKAIIGR